MDVREWRLILNPPVGAEFRYRFTLDLDMGDQNLLVSGVRVVKVLKKTEGGEIVLESRVERASAKLNDKEIPAVKMPVVQTTMRPNGIPVKSAAQVEGSPVQGLTLPTHVVVYPDKPVKVGDKWEGSLALRKDEPPLKGQYELVGTERLHGRETLKIKVTIRAAKTEGSESPRADGFAWVDPRDGTLIKLDIHYQNWAVGVPIPVDAKQQMERLPSGSGTV